MHSTSNSECKNAQMLTLHQPYTQPYTFLKNRALQPIYTRPGWFCRSLRKAFRFKRPKAVSSSSLKAQA
jgi:hypothetical protein